MTVVVELAGGDIKCSSVEPACDSTAPPAYRIVVDFGDGSGGSLWTQDENNDIFSHVYSVPGTYGVAVSSNINENSPKFFPYKLSFL